MYTSTDSTTLKASARIVITKLGEIKRPQTVSMVINWLMLEGCAHHVIINGITKTAESES